MKTSLLVVILAAFVAIAITVFLVTGKNPSVKTSVNMNSVNTTTDASINATNTATNTEVTPKWRLISGDPKDTCTTPTYNGEAKIHGWYVYETSYVEKEWLLRIADDDVDKTPVKSVYSEADYNSYKTNPVARISDVTPETVTKLKNASRSNPAEITIKGFRAYCEGSPYVSLNGY